MRLRFLALVTAASGLALATAANADGGHGGGGNGGHGGIGAPINMGAAAGVSGGIGPGMGGSGHIGGGAPGLGGGGMGGGLGPGMGASSHIGGGAAGLGGASSSGSLGPGMSASGRMNSQGPAHASATGIAHADSHSVLAGATPRARTDNDNEAAERNEAAEHRATAKTAVTSVSSGTLSGLADGQTVKTSSGASLGTVSKILVNASGTPVAVIVTQANGEKVRLPAKSLTFASGVVTTTSAKAVREANETHEANEHPTSITTGVLAGLATGETVQSSSGTSLGTVSRILVSDNGTVRAVLVTGANGRRFALPASSLSISGSTVTTTKAMVTAHR